MIIDSNLVIKSIKPSEIKYLNRDIYNFFGYDSGFINQSDLIIWIDKYSEDTKIQLYDGLIDMDLMEFGVYYISIIKYKDNDVNPLIKDFRFGTVIDTVFCGDEICIESNDTSIQISINKSKMDFELLKQTPFIAIYRNEQLIFYTHDEINNEDIKKILKERKFDGHLNNNAMLKNEYKFEKIIDENILEFFKKYELQSSVRNFYNGYLPFRDEIAYIEIYRFSEFYSIDLISNNEADELIEKIYSVKKAISRNNSDEFRLINISDIEFPSIISVSDKMKKIKTLIKRVSVTNASVILLGESGTGKSLIAKEIHLKSKRSSKPFININCASIPETLIESELFGYDEGAFTGAKKKGKIGYFEMANGGTLFLDEIAELPLSSQSRLLEVIQNKSFYRVGGNAKIFVDVRIIAATNQNLDKRIDEKTFRRDLFYRLNVFPITLPPLRQRKEDIEILSKKLLPKICARLEIEPLIISKKAIELLKTYDWPGNIRELENVLEQSAIMCDSKLIEEEHITLLSNNRLNQCENSLKSMVENYEKEIILSVLQECGKKKSKVCNKLSIPRTTLFDKMKKYGIED